MDNRNHFDVLIVVTPSDCKRLLNLYPRLIDNFKYGKLVFIGAPEVGEIVLNDEVLKEHVKWVDENELISFDEVHTCMSKKLEPVIGSESLPRGITGWYYQQFLKMQYAYSCKDEYYMVWDGDTVPCREINMFSGETGQPYLDLKHEHHPEYFDTMGKILPGFRKVIERSFISEHMLMKCDIMKALIDEIEKNDSIPGTKFWEKIINCIEPDKIYDSAFSEFETYGTFVALRFPSVYKLREWHSFRLGGSFFDKDTICDRDFEWLSRDFDAISFEKGQNVREDNKNFFDNPEYQKKLSAKKMLQLAQMEYKDGYKEVWEDDMQLQQGANVTIGGFHNSEDREERILIVIVSYNSQHLMEQNIKSIRDVLNPGSYQIVVVDNASTDGVVDYLEQQEDVKLIKNAANIGFGPACNMAVASTLDTEYEKFDILLLNNDTRLVFDSVYYLKQALYSADDIGAVGSISNYAGNKQQVDVTFESVEEYIKYGEKNNVPMSGVYLERVRLSGFAMLIRRQVWDEIGGFDEDFAPGYYEDDALSIEILKRGYRLLLVRNSFIYHVGSQSFIKTDYEKLLNEHHLLFEKKYGFDILKYCYASGTALSQIPYNLDSRFSMLQLGCGLGSELKAVRSLFTNSEVVGIENNPTLYEIVSKTEKAFRSIEELKNSDNRNAYDILIADKKIYEGLGRLQMDALSSVLRNDAVIIIKNQDYEDFSYEKIKLIIWDMDETFWHGIISEGDVELPLSNVELIKNATDHGVINSISSKNDEEPVLSELKSVGIDELFVFNNINWDDKGRQIETKIKNMGLRAENVLFIDDSVRNLEEAKYHCTDLMTATPDIIPYLVNFFAKTVAKDKEHSRLDQYKLLEKKLQAKTSYENNEQFLYDSDIRITINKDCLKEIDRITELVARSNQLNYTKNRENKDLLTRLVTDDWYDCAYIRAQDKFGEYGIIGFYCYNTREKFMRHFLFSCRVIGMGIEQYIYNLLGCPDFEIKGKISVPLEKNKEVTWIKEDSDNEISSDFEKEKRVRILMKGPCDMDSTIPYLRGGNITTEFNYVNERGFTTTGQNHTMHIWQSAHMCDEEIEEIINEVPFIIKGDFETKLFKEEYHIICLSTMQDLNAGLYKNKKTGAYISFSSQATALTDLDNVDGFIRGEYFNHDFPFTREIIEKFAENWEFVGITPVDLLLRNLDYIYDHVKGRPEIILMLGSEIQYEGEQSVGYAGLVDIYRAYNPILQEFAEDHERMHTINITDFIHSQNDFEYCINHFSRNVYYKIAGEIVRIINDRF
nr:DUF6492 family protein [uncultured Butyrivibrio sp.]